MALLTVRAAADRLGIGYSTLKQWIYQGRIRTTHTAGGHHRIADAEVDRFVARQTPADAAGRPKSTAATGLIVALSGRNRLRGFVEEVRTDGLLGAGPPAHRRPAPDSGDHRRRHRGAEAEARRLSPRDHQVHRGHDRARSGAPGRAEATDGPRHTPP